MKKRILMMLIIAIPVVGPAQHFGESGHPMNKRTDNLDILKFWDLNSEEDIEIYRSIYNLFQEDKNATYKDIIENEHYRSLRKEHDLHLLGGPMLGDIGQDHVSIWIRSSKPSGVQVKLSSEVDTLRSRKITTDVENDLAGVINVEGLDAATTYSYSLIIDDTVTIESDHFHFETLPPTEHRDSVRIAFGSCPHRWGLGNEKLLNTIKERSPDAMFLLGDIAVQDRNDNYALHRADYLLRDFQTAWKNFASAIPVYANWDDHDYFDNDDAGIPEGYSNEDRKGVREIFKHSWVNPSYGLHDQGIFYKTVLGGVEIITIDNRYFRGGEKSPFLGDMQEEWLKKQIRNSRSPFLILSSGTMWSDYVSNGKDSWGVYDPDGREEILNLIEEHNLSAVLLISGDRHGARGFTIERESGLDLFEFEVASLGARVGPPKSKPEWTNQLYGIDGTFAFGEFTFDPSQANGHVTFRLIDQEGTVLYSRDFKRKDLMSKR